MNKTLRAWKRALARSNKFQAKAEKAAEELKTADEKHRETAPIPEDLRKKILDAHEQGRTFCCEAGRKTLKSLGVDECWLEYINHEAYEHMGCSSGHKPGGQYYEHERKWLHRILDGR